MDLRIRLREAHRRLDSLTAALRRDIDSKLMQAHARVDHQDGQLRQLSPLRVLDRGYALVQKMDGTLVTDAAQAPAGTNLRVRLAAGNLMTTVDSTSE
jgi:exodeoxyribonuclease VII large subunit